MPDYAMCQHKTCKKRETCYRFKAEPSPNGRQVYYEFKPLKSGACKAYWPIKQEKLK